MVVGVLHDDPGYLAHHLSSLRVQWQDRDSGAWRTWCGYQAHEGQKAQDAALWLSKRETPPIEQTWPNDTRPECIAAEYWNGALW